MGLQKEITTADGVTHSTAYFKVQAPRIDHTAKRARFGILVWKNKASRDTNPPKEALKNPLKDSFDVRNVGEATDFDDYFGDAVLKAAGNSPVSQAYAFAKLHADYSDASDVLEE